MMAPPPVYLQSVEYRLGDLTPIAEADADLRVKQDIDALRANGLRTFSVVKRPLDDLVRECMIDTLVGRECEEIDGLFLVTESFSQLPTSQMARAETPFASMRNTLLRMFVELGVGNAKYFATSFGGSSNFLQAVFLAKPLVESGTVRNLLVLCADRHPPRLSRVMHDAGAIAGDGVAACLLASEPAKNGASWQIEHVGITPSVNLARRDKPNLAGLDAYRSSRAAVQEAYAKVGRRADEFDAVIMNNYNLAHSRAFASLLGVGLDRVFLANMGRTGHLPSCDSLINLHDLAKSRPVPDGSRVLIFVVGPVSFGAISVVRAPAARLDPVANQHPA